MPVIIAVLTTGAAGITLAGPGGGRGGPGGGPRGGGAGHRPPPVSAADLTKYDSDGDGKLSAEEKAVMKAALEAERVAWIAKYDVDGDGLLNAEERAAAKAAQEAAREEEKKAKFAGADADSSGGISLAELTAAMPEASAERVQACFDRIDANGDDSISLDEYLAKPGTPVPGAASGARSSARARR